MLRSLLLILLIVNAAFYAWSQGWLNELTGVRPDEQREPARLQQQVHADRIVVIQREAGQAGASGPASVPSAAPAGSPSSSPTVLPNAPAASGASQADDGASAAAGMATEASAPNTSSQVASAQCLEAGPFNNAEYSNVVSSLRTVLPVSAWSNQVVLIQGLWLVYMGPYADAEMLARKQDELRRIKGLNFEEVRTPANLAMGVSLGRYTRLEEAGAALQVLRNRGIRTARVVNIRPNTEVQLLRVPQATPGIKAKLDGLKLPQGKGFTACRP